MATHPITRYVPLLIAGDEGGLRDLFSGAPRVNDPYLGWVEDARFAEFVETSHATLRERAATVEHVHTTANAARATEECVVRMVRPAGTVTLPVALAGDTSSDAHLESVRVYHSMRALLGYSLPRPPTMPPLSTLVLPDVIGRYHDCLARRDLAGILEQFAPDGELRESVGAEAVHRGLGELRRFFTVLFSGGGGPGFEHCAIVDEGASCSVESVVTAWGRSPFPPQAAAAVYERADTGLLSGVRMYDDVELPLARN